MLVFVDLRVEPKEMSIEQLWEIWEEEANAALDAKDAGKVVSLYKVSGQRRVVGILDVDSTDELDQILMAGLPIAHYLKVEEAVPVREYEAFATDLRERWGRQRA
jgi:muconolactone D-isomerase